MFCLMRSINYAKKKFGAEAEARFALIVQKMKGTLANDEKVSEHISDELNLKLVGYS